MRLTFLRFQTQGNNIKFKKEEMLGLHQPVKSIDFFFSDLSGFILSHSNLLIMSLRLSFSDV